MSTVITKTSKKKDKRQVNEKNCNLEREYIKKAEKTRLGSQGIS